jgi:hypothetical protein
MDVWLAYLISQRLRRCRVPTQAEAQRLRLTILNLPRGTPFATAAKLRELARQVQSDYCRDQLLRIAQGFDRLAKHAEEWRLAAPRED